RSPRPCSMPTAGDLSGDLRRFLAGEPIRARPIGAWARGVRWARRRPAIAALIGIIVLVTAAGFGGVTWQWQQAEAAREQAESAARRELEVSSYVQLITLADRELAASNPGRAEELLAECPA